MAKYALSLFCKIVLFALVMLIVANAVPYERLVYSITGLFNFENADRLTRFILGEPDLEIWESLDGYFSILINTLISVPVMSVFITAYRVVTNKVSPAVSYRDWGLSTLRRIGKILGFIFLSWALSRFLPYDSVFPEQTYPNFIIAVIAGFHLLLSLICYRIITKKIITKRSL